MSSLTVAQFTTELRDLSVVFFILFLNDYTAFLFFFIISVIYPLHLSHMVMDPVIIVSGKWIMKKRYVFNVDSRGCRVLHLGEKTKLEDFTKSVIDDYGLNDLKVHILLSYMFSNKTLKTMAHNTPPVYVSNTRQLQCFLSLKKSEQLRLCVEITEKKDDSSDVEASEEEASEEEASEEEASEEDASEEEALEEEALEVESIENGSYDGCSLEDEQDEIENDCFSNVEIHDVAGEDEIGKENEEDDEFESRFDMFDDSDGASSEDDNFSTYGESPIEEDEDSPTLPSKKRYQNFLMSESKGNLEVLKLEMSSLDLAVGQRYLTKKHLKRRLKLFTVRHQFDFDVEISNLTTYVVKCWVDGCTWRVRASTEGLSPQFYIRIYDSDHACSVTERSNRSRNATPDILGELYKNFLGDVGPAVRPESVGIAITKQFGVKVIMLQRLSYGRV